MKNLLVKILKILRNVIVAFLVLAILATLVLRGSNYLHHKLQLKNGVNETTYLDLNGQEQYVMMMGEDISNPVIIYLHGGPASPDTYISYSFADYLTADYTFIGWDQRGCGRTYFRNEERDPGNATATFAQALDDLDQLVSYACERFGQDQVIIMGHSYGSMLGSVYACEHPDRVSAYIGIGQFVSIEDADLYSYQDALNQADAEGKKALEDAYTAYCEDPGIQTLIQLRNQTSLYHPVTKEADQFGLSLFSPYAGIDDIRWFTKQFGDLDSYVALNQKLYDEVLKYNAYDTTMEFGCPVCFISGAQDWVCPTDQSEAYLDALDAPAKKMYRVDGCGHDVHCASPEEFSEDVISFLRDQDIR
ncbi:MAG: alpha/beta hydrolase [Lachnospiraceae bacterium]|nr:alpha/beta hydrolase [Lachnospiraceae bacterium]